MFISDLNYLEVANADVVGGGRNGGGFFKVNYQKNFNYTYQEANAYAKTFKGDAYADAYNYNYTEQENKID